MKKRYRDFDAFYAEQNREPVTIRLFGEDHNLAPSLPAAMVLKMLRMQKEHGELAVVPHQEMLDMAVMLFGEKRLTKWSEDGLDIEQLGELIKWTMQQYLGGVEEDTDEGNAPKTEGLPST